MKTVRVVFGPCSFLILILLLLCGATGALWGATPSSGTINTPSDTSPGLKQTILYTGGPIANGLVGDVIVANTASFTCKRANPPTACDWFDLYVNPPSSFYSATRIGLVQVHVTWQLVTGVGDPAVSDLDLYIIKCATNADGTENCTTVGNMAQSTDTNAPPPAGTGRAEETVALFDPAPGHYRILVVGSVVTVPANYSATLTYSIVPPPAPPPATASILQTFVPPVPTDGSPRMGTKAAGGEGEPSIGVNNRTGNAMVQSGLQTLRLSFDDSIYPATSAWTSVGSTITSQISLDPILWMDPHTNRTFVSQLMGGCSLMAYSDTDGGDGTDWFQNPIGCGFVTAVDHQTVGGGPFKSPLTSTDVVGNYPDNVMYCAQGVADAECAQSTNGGILFGPGFPTYTINDCGGLHGHVRVGPEGNMYLPNGSCNGQQALVVSTNGGVTWTVHAIPGSSNHSDNGDSDPWVETAQDGTVYFGYANGDGHAMVAVSHDAGNTWSTPFDAGAAVQVVNTEFAAVAAGDPNRAAFAFLGTTTPGNTQASSFAGDWYLYVAFTYDGGSTWTTYNATPNDPVQRGCIWNQGGGNPCRNLLDFNGIAIDKVGRVLVVYTDGCIDDPLNASVRCVSGPDYSKSVLTTVARQSGGLGLLGAYDGQIFKTVPGAPVLSGIAGNSVNHLTWKDGSNGNSPITAHTVFRGTASGGEAALATLSGTATSYDDTSVTNGLTYYYQVNATNAVGVSPRSNEQALTPQVSAPPAAPRRLKSTAKQGGVMLTWSAPKDQGTSPVTGYRIYRSTAPGLETFQAAVGNTTHFTDDGLTSGTTYYYVVTAVSAAGESARSNEDTAQPK